MDVPFVRAPYVKYRAQHILWTRDTLENLMQGGFVFLSGLLQLWKTFLEVWTDRAILLMN